MKSKERRTLSVIPLTETGREEGSYCRGRAWFLLTLCLPLRTTSQEDSLTKRVWGLKRSTAVLVSGTTTFYIVSNGEI